MAAESRGACDRPHNPGFGGCSVSLMDYMVSRAETIVKTAALASGLLVLVPSLAAWPCLRLYLRKVVLMLYLRLDRWNQHSRPQISCLGCASLIFNLQTFEFDKRVSSQNHASSVAPTPNHCKECPPMSFSPVVRPDQRLV